MPYSRELNLLYVHSQSMGYGRLGTNLAKALEKDGVGVYDDLGEGPPDLALLRKLEQGADAYKQKQCNLVCWVSTPGHARWWWSGQETALFTMWEARVLPEQFRETLHEFDTLVVPSMQNLELFSPYHPNVQLCYLGIDPALWHYTPRTSSPFFTFLIAGSGPRKGTDLAYEAFQRVFGDWKGDGKIPRLIMKSPRGEDVGGPNIEVRSGRLSQEQEIATYEEADCYLQPSRGEGFGLQPLQAIAQGVPTILTADHGHAAFAELGIPISSKPSKAAYFIYGDAGEWWEPDFDELCAAMRDVYDHPHTHLEFAERSAVEVAERFTWANTARHFESLFHNALLHPYAGSGEFYLPEARLFRVITNSDRTSDIGGHMFHFEKGKEYWMPADVKRIYFEASYLDPACLDNGEGLLPHQVANIEGYTKEQMTCPTCRRPY